MISANFHRRKSAQKHRKNPQKYALFVQSPPNFSKSWRNCRFQHFVQNLTRFRLNFTAKNSRKTAQKPAEIRAFRAFFAEFLQITAKPQIPSFCPKSHAFSANFHHRKSAQNSAKFRRISRFSCDFHRISQNHGEIANFGILRKISRDFFGFSLAEPMPKKCPKQCKKSAKSRLFHEIWRLCFWGKLLCKLYKTERFTATAFASRC